MFRRTAIHSVAAALLLLVPVSVWAGNSRLVEQRIRELDALNKKIVRESILLPATGRLHLKAKVYDRPSGNIFILISKNFSETKEGVFPFTTLNRPSL